MTVLIRAVYVGTIEIVKLLLDAGADVNVCADRPAKPFLKTALRAATWHKSHEIRMLLLTAGAVDHE